MKALRLLAPLCLLPLLAVAAERPLKIDRARSFVDVDVDATKNFTAHLDAYAATVLEEAGKIKSAVFTFKFADLKSGNTDRDADMIKWLGGGKPKVIDGPFAESKELIGGYWIISVKSREEAIEWASRCPAGKGDMIELRQIYEMEDYPADVREAAKL